MFKHEQQKSTFAILSNFNKMSATTDTNSSKKNRYATTRCPHPHDTALASVQFFSLYANWTVCRSVGTRTASHLIYYVTRGADNLQLEHSYCCKLGPHNAADMNRQTQRLLCVTRQASCVTPAHVRTYVESPPQPRRAHQHARL